MYVHMLYSHVHCVHVHVHVCIYMCTFVPFFWYLRCMRPDTEEQFQEYSNYMYFSDDNKPGGRYVQRLEPNVSQ